MSTKQTIKAFRLNDEPPKVETVFNTRQKPMKVTQLEAALVYDGSRTVNKEYYSIALDSFGTVYKFELTPADMRELVDQLKRVAPCGEFD